MSGKTGHVWTVAGITPTDKGWAITEGAECSKREFVELREQALFVGDLASLEDCDRVASAARRFHSLVAAAHSELSTQQHLSPRTAAALPLDLLALSTAARRLEDRLSARVDGAAELPSDAVAAFHDIRHGVRASHPYLVVPQMASRASAGEIVIVLRAGEIYFEGSVHRSVRDIVSGLLGMVLSLFSAYLHIFSDDFDRFARELERAAAVVTNGTPHLIAYQSGVNGPRQLEMKQLPLREIAALRKFYAARQPDELGVALWRLASANARASLCVDDVDISTALVDSQASNGLNELPTAEFELDSRLLGAAPLDYWGVMRYQVETPDSAARLFAGSVRSASLENNRILVKCEGAVDLIERAGGGTLASGLSSAELVHSLLVATGLAADEVTLGESVPDQPEERFEVLLPIRGLHVRGRLELCGVEIIPICDGEDTVARFDENADAVDRLKDGFANAESYGRAYVSDVALPGAEEQGVIAIETAVAWLVARARYGLAQLPDGQILPFVREESLRVPEAGTVVLVRGLATGRCWLRNRRRAAEPVVRRLDHSSALMAGPRPSKFPSGERHALSALRRATSASTLEDQLHALWEAVEFYAAGGKPPKLFSRAELDRLRHSPPDWMDEEQRSRFVSKVGGLNHEALRPRVMRQADQDGVPLTDSEHDLLFRTLRVARNEPAHGRRGEAPPTRAEVHRGIGLVARLLVYRAARRVSEVPTDGQLG